MNYNVIGADGAVYGPVDFETLKRWAAEGRVNPDSAIEEVGSGKRVPANTIPGLFAAPQAPQAPTHQLHPGYDVPTQPAYTPPGVGPGGAPRPGVPPGAAANAVQYPRNTFAEPVKNHLAKAIFSTLCCCLPLGVVAIVYAAQVGSKQAGGDYYGAKESSDNAEKWANISIVLGLIGNVIGAGIRFMLHK